MKAFIYQAALLCESCGVAKQTELNRIATQHDNPHYGYREDSNNYPQGPYGEGGGEADCPQHCDACGRFLENPLTTDGTAYVRDLISQHHANGRGSADVLKTLAEFYGVAFEESNHA